MVSRKPRAKYQYSVMGKLHMVGARYKQAQAKAKRAQATCNKLKAEMKKLVIQL